MRTDPIFLAFQKWVRWATATPRNSPTTGLVVGNTWKDFCREYCGGNQRVMYFVVKDAKDKPDKNIVNGYVHVKGFLTDCTLSVNNAVSMRRLLKAQLGCLVVDLEMLLLSLLRQLGILLLEFLRNLFSIFQLFLQAVEFCDILLLPLLRCYFKLLHL